MSRGCTDQQDGFGRNGIGTVMTESMAMHDDDHTHDSAGHDWAGHGAAAPSLDLGEEERLPWLESADDIEAEPHGRGSARLIMAVALAVLLLLALVAAVYWLTHRGKSAVPADGSVIEASTTPYKVAPNYPGGKQFAGTGDASFKVSQGEHPDASLAGSAGTTPPPAAATPSPAPAASGSAPAKPAPAPAPAQAPAAHVAGGGVAVQVGAYSSSSRAESEWSKLVSAHDQLQGVGHRVVEAQADIGTVYRLQALAGDLAAANSLCSRLQAVGVKCQVKKP